ncbi:LCP family protein [Oenococcus sp.]|uniref:LCP family protein n=1 Tax=Oenococcus sp. TaxID=1979414 RepID=UPI0039E9192B
MPKTKPLKAGRERRPGKKNRHLIRNILLTVFGVFFIAIGITFFIAYSNIKGAINTNTFVPTKLKKSRDVNSVLNDGRPVSILLMGTDTGELGRSWVGRTDSMILVTINPKTKRTLLMSIPRDSMIAIPGYEDTFPQKINAAYEYPANGQGHPETTIRTVQKWLNVPIDFYAVVNMGALEEVVNRAGGISVKSPLSFAFSSDTAHAYGAHLYRFTKDSDQYSYYADGINLTKTSRVMDGTAALAFARMRYEDPLSDYGRTLRQRLILEAIAKKAGSLIPQIINQRFLNSISKQAQTDLSFNDMLALGSKYRSAIKRIDSDHLQGVGYKYGLISFEIIPTKERQRATDKIRKFLGLPAGQTGPKFAGTVSNGVVIDDGTQDSTATAASQQSYTYTPPAAPAASYSSSYTAPAYTAPAASSTASSAPPVTGESSSSDDSTK